MIARLRWLYFLYYAGVGTFLSYFALICAGWDSPASRSAW